MQTITIDQLRDIYHTACRGNKIAAIKTLREATNHPTLGVAMYLSEAKRIVELISDARAYNNERPDFGAVVSLLSVVRRDQDTQDTAEPQPTVRAAISSTMEDPELAAMGRVVAEFDKLPAGAVPRIIAYLARRFGA